MINRRVVLAGAAAAGASGFAISRAQAADGFAAFLAGVQAEARGMGIASATLSAAFNGVGFNARVIELDRNQPEFKLSFAQYRQKVIPQARIDAGRAAVARDGALLQAAAAKYGADPRVVAGIWGIESGFGQTTGKFRIVEALATLAYEGRRASYFRGELFKALRILDNGDIAAGKMTGSWAGAMGQPQFMPSSYLQYAVDFDGDGRRDIWSSRADVFGSIANYLGRNGWRAGEPWGQRIRLPANFQPAIAGRDAPRTLGQWQAIGVRRVDGSAFSRSDVRGAVVIPDGPQGEAFMVYPNFAAIRRYNPSDYYALAVGLLGYALS